MIHHEELIRRTLEIAQRARDHGNHPFGALLVDERGHILIEAENTVVTERDCTGRFPGRVHTLYLHRAVSDVRRSDLLGQCWTGRIWIEYAGLI